MAAKPAEKKGSVKKNSKASKVYKIYSTSGSTLSRKNQTCPKCGPGTFLAAHKDRLTCGRCHYMEKK